MKKMPKDTVIIGAGPAGMACAMELTKADQKVTIIEKDEKVGGLAKTIEFKEGDLLFRTDIGPHRFFSKNKYLYDFIGDLLKEDWRLIPRQTRQFIDGKFYDYPVKAMQAFRNIGLLRAIRMVLDYFIAATQYGIFKKDIKSFEDYIVANFGRTLGEFNMLNYTEKIWGTPCKQLHPDWAKQRIKGLNLISALKNAIFKDKKKKKQSGPKSLVDHFYYPEYGTGLIYETIAKRTKEKGSDIHTKSHPTKIHHRNFKIDRVECNINGQTKEFTPKTLVNSMPINEFLELLSPAPPEEVKKAAKQLKWRAQSYLFLTLDKERVTRDNWIYFPNKEIPFGRVAEMKNFSDKMNPKGKTSLFIEFFVYEGDEIWNMDKDELFEMAMPYFEKMNFFKREDVRNHYLMQRKHVYPIYDLEYMKHLDVIKGYLDLFENLIYIGRPGRFKYTNQDHSLEMGILAARSILEGRRLDVEDVGSEKEYFESGSIKRT